MMNALTGKEHVESYNRLFETLRTTSKNFSISTNLKGIVIDTIGFIDNLPAELIDSFGSTLREIESADIVILMEDLSHPLMESQRTVALKLIEKLGLNEMLTPDRFIRVWNKADMVTPTRIATLLDQEPEENRENIVICSVRDGKGIKALKTMIENKMNVLWRREPRLLEHYLDVHDERVGWLRR